jgi:LPXTG-motif cell wall-anchored protein
VCSLVVTNTPPPPPPPPTTEPTTVPVIETTVPNAPTTPPTSFPDLPSTLPATGSSGAQPLLLMALAIVPLGAALVLITRRRSATQ